MENQRTDLKTFSVAEKVRLLRKKLEAREKQERFIFPQSQPQKAIYLNYLADPLSSAYNVGFAATIRSEFNRDMLERAFEAIAERHACLRTVYFLKGDQPFQEIQSVTASAFFETDATIWSSQELRQKVKEDYNRPFDLEKGPVFRTTLFRGAHNHCVLLFVIHHISCDAWSLMLLMEDVQKYYVSATTGGTLNLPPLEWDYLDFVKTQNLFLSGIGGKKARDYWVNRLSGEPEDILLPLDRKRPMVQTFTGSSLQFKLPTQLHRELKALAKGENVTLFILLLSVFELFLYRYTGQKDILIGTTDTGRDETRWQHVVGNFVNLLVIRADLNGPVGFRDFILKVKKWVLHDLSNKNYPFTQLVNEMKIQRDPSKPPLVQVVFSMLKAKDGNDLHQLQKPGNENMRIKWAGLDLEHFPLAQQEGQFDFTLNLVEDGDGISGTIKYNTDLFNADTIEKMAGDYTRLLKGVAGRPKVHIDELQWLSAEEKKAELAKSHFSAEFNPSIICIHEEFERQALGFPGRIALVSEKEALTYEELNCRANRVAHCLLKLGVGPEAPVGILLDRSMEMAVAILGILKAGGAYLPLDPALPADRIEYMIKNSTARIVIIDSKKEQVYVPGEVEILYLDMTNQAEAHNPTLRVDISNLAYILYTSGSTGLPKGVLVEHRQLAYYLKAVLPLLKVGEGDHFTSAATMSADGIYTQLFGALCTGGTMHILSKDLVMDSKEMAGYFSRHPIDCLKVTPSYLNALLVSGMGEEILPAKCLVVGGEAFDPMLLERIQSLRPACSVFNHYGPTETTIGVSLFPIPESAIVYPVQSLPIGYPLPHSQLFLLDSNLCPVPPGVKGEIYIGGKGVSRGYLGSPKLTAEKFIPHPYTDSPGERLYKTGDLGRRWPDGAIEFLGRIDKQVKIRGNRVESGEIEAALMSYPGIAQAVTQVISNKATGQELVAYIQFKQPGGAELSDIRGFLQSRLPNYMLPAAIVFLDKIPLNPIGKIDYKALPLPATGNRECGHNIIIPLTWKERTLAEIWQKVLKVEKVGRYDNFFSLGGDSIMCIQIISEARNAGLVISPREVFQHQTIASLALVANNAQGSASTGPVSGALPLTPIQEGFFSFYGETVNQFSQSVLLETTEEISVPLLSQALRLLEKHHDALRIRFRRSGESWDQYYLPDAGTVFLDTEDFSMFSEGKSDQKIRETTESFQAKFDISKGPIFQANFFNAGPNKTSLLLLMIHHLVVDAFSWRIILEDLFAIYNQLRQSHEVVLPAKSSSFKEWAEKLKEHADLETIHDQAGFWEQQGRPAFFTGGLFSEKIVPDLQERQVTIQLTSKLTQLLLGRASQVFNASTSELLIIALAVAFQDICDGSGLALTIEGHGREDIFSDINLSRTVGWFTTKYPLLIKPPVNATLEAQVKEIKEQLHQVPGKGIGYGLLRHLCQEPEIRKRMAGIPQPEILFNFLGKIDRNVNDSWKLNNKNFKAYRGFGVQRTHLVQIIGLIIDNELHFQWEYHPGVTAIVIDQFSARFKDILIQLIEHSAEAGVSAYVPSDFPSANLNQAQLDHLLSKLK